MSKYLLIILVWIALYAVPLFLHPMHKPDEARYAEIAREMAASNDWLIMKINGMPYPEKPPMFTWLTAAGFKLFGPKIWVGRMVSALSMLLLSLALFATTKKLIGSAAALISSIVALSQLASAGIGQLCIIDPIFAFFIGLTVLFSVRVILGKSKKYYWFFGIAASLSLAGAMLSKGPAGLILAGGIVSLWAIITGNFKKLLLFIINPIFWIVTFIFIYIYYHFAEKQLPGISNYFFIHENILRYFTKVHKRGQPLWFFIPVFLGGALPWTIVMPFVIHFYYKYKAAWLKDKVWLWLAIIWMILPVAFFSLSDSKLPTYILLSFFGVGLFVGLWLHRISTDEYKNEYNKITKFIRVLYTILCYGLAVAALIFGVIFMLNIQLAKHLAPEPSISIWCMIAAFISIILATLIYLYNWKSLTKLLIISNIIIIVATGLIIRVTNLQAGQLKLIAKLKKMVKPNVIVVQYSVLDSAIPFTLQRNISSALVSGDMRYTTVKSRLNTKLTDMFDYYFRGNPNNISPTNWPCPKNVWYDQKDFLKLFTSDKPVLVYTKTRYLAWLKNIKVYSLANDQKYSIIANEAYFKKYK